MKKTCVIFDLDGTLLDSLKDIATCCNLALADKGMPHKYNIEDYHGFVGDGLRKTIERALPEEHRSEAFISEVKALFDACYEDGCSVETKPYKGIMEMLERLIDSDIKLAVLTNKGDNFAKAMVEEYFPCVFDVVLGQRDGLPNKPDPASIREILDTLGIPAEEAVMVGDSDIDVFTAQNAGVTAVAVPWGYHRKDRLKAAKPDYMAKTPASIADFVLK